MSDIERIERQLIQIKWIFLFISILLLIGLFTPRGLLDEVGIILLVPVVIGVAIYLFLKIAEAVLKEKIEVNARQTEEELSMEISRKEEEISQPSAEPEGTD